MEGQAENFDSDRSFGKFVLHKRLGVGGMAEVFLAEMVGPEGFGKLVALKRMLPNLTSNQSFVASFISEGRLGGSLNHPNIVQTLELGCEGAHYYLAMEYVQGLTLAALLHFCRREKLVLPLGIVLDIARQLCDGLEYAHTATDPRGTPLHIIHRDLKPENILLSQFGVAKITDFGVAKATSNLLLTSIDVKVKGTVAYMSPEQAGCEELDHRSDLYSLGAILFEMLTLERLYPDAHGVAGLFRVRKGDVSERLPLLEGFPPALVATVTRLLAAKRDERYDSAADVRRDLAAVASSLPPSSADLRTIIRETADVQAPLSGAATSHPRQHSHPTPSGSLSLALTAAATATVQSVPGPGGAARPGGGARPGDGAMTSASMMATQNQDALQALQGGAVQGELSATLPAQTVPYGTVPLAASRRKPVSGLEAATRPRAIDPNHVPSLAELEGMGSVFHSLHIAMSESGDPQAVTRIETTRKFPEPPLVPPPASGREVPVLDLDPEHSANFDPGRMDARGVISNRDLNKESTRLLESAGRPDGGRTSTAVDLRMSAAPTTAQRPATPRAAVPPRAPVETSAPGIDRLWFWAIGAVVFVGLPALYFIWQLSHEEPVRQAALTSLQSEPPGSVRSEPPGQGWSAPSGSEPLAAEPPRGVPSPLPAMPVVSMASDSTAAARAGEVAGGSSSGAGAVAPAMMGSSPAPLGGAAAGSAPGDGQDGPGAREAGSAGSSPRSSSQERSVQAGQGSSAPSSSQERSVQAGQGSSAPSSSQERSVQAGQGSGASGSAGAKKPRTRQASTRRALEQPIAARPPAPAEKPSAANGGAVGYLTVNAMPSATVYLDGKKLQETPLLRVQLPAGRHQLEFVTSDGRSHKEPLDLAAGEEKKLAPIRFE